MAYSANRDAERVARFCADASCGNSSSEDEAAALALFYLARALLSPPTRDELSHLKRNLRDLSSNTRLGVEAQAGVERALWAVHGDHREFIEWAKSHLGDATAALTPPPGLSALAHQGDVGSAAPHPASKLASWLDASPGTRQQQHRRHSMRNGGARLVELLYASATRGAVADMLWRSEVLKLHEEMNTMEDDRDDAWEEQDRLESEVVNAVQLQSVAEEAHSLTQGLLTQERVRLGELSAEYEVLKSEKQKLAEECQVLKDRCEMVRNAERFLRNVTVPDWQKKLENEVAAHKESVSTLQRECHELTLKNRELVLKSIPPDKMARLDARVAALELAVSAKDAQLAHSRDIIKRQTDEMDAEHVEWANICRAHKLNWEEAETNLESMVNKRAQELISHFETQLRMECDTKITEMKGNLLDQQRSYEKQITETRAEYEKKVVTMEDGYKRLLEAKESQIAELHEQIAQAASIQERDWKNGRAVAKATSRFKNERSWTLAERDLALSERDSARAECNMARIEAARARKDLAQFKARLRVANEQRRAAASEKEQAQQLRAQSQQNPYDQIALPLAPANTGNALTGATVAGGGRAQTASRDDAPKTTTSRQPASTMSRENESAEQREHRPEYGARSKSSDTKALKEDH